jgi:hypothetical protein
VIDHARRFPPPWSVKELDACFVVRDGNGQALAYVYFEDEPGRLRNFIAGGHITKVVLQVLFMQQNQREKNDWPNCFASMPSYSRICIGWPQRGQESPSPGMTMDFLRFRFPVNAPHVLF